MVSKSRKQRQVQKAKQLSGNTEPTPISTGKSIHLKKKRPNMKRKMKVRMGHESADIYDGFENSKQVNWTCPKCNRVGRVVGFCTTCEAEKITTAASNSNSSKPKQARSVAAAAGNNTRVVGGCGTAGGGATTTSSSKKTAKSAGAKR